MVWTDGAAGISFSQTLLSNLAAQIPDMEKPDIAEVYRALLGIENGTEREVGAVLLHVLHEKGIELPQQAAQGSGTRLAGPLGVGQRPHTAACASGWPCSRRTGSWLRT